MIVGPAAATVRDLVLHHGRAPYVEGFASPAKGDLAMLHAWVTNPKNPVVAHEPDKKLSEKDARDYYNVFDAPAMKRFIADPPFESFQTPVECIQLLIAVSFVRVSGRLRQLREQRIWDRALLEEMQDVLKKLPRGGKGVDDTDASIRARFERLIQEQSDMGKSEKHD